METKESELRDDDDERVFEMECEFSFELAFRTSDQACVCADMIRSLGWTRLNGVEAQVYYVPNKPAVDSGEELFRASLKALLAENCTQTVFMEDVNHPEQFDVTLDLHLDGAEEATHLSSTLVDYSREVLKSRHTIPRNVCVLQRCYLLTQNEILSSGWQLSRKRVMGGSEIEAPCQTNHICYGKNRLGDEEAHQWIQCERRLSQSRSTRMQWAFGNFWIS